MCATLCNNVGISFTSPPIVQENVRNTLQQCRHLFFGGFPNSPSRKKESRIPKKKLGIPHEKKLGISEWLCCRLAFGWLGLLQEEYEKYISQ